MKTYETATIHQSLVTVDVSKLGNSEELYFNATEMAKLFDKHPAHWLRLPETVSYIDALLNVRLSHNKNLLIQTYRGKHGGTYLHNDLAFQFARWLSPVFAVELDQWIKDRFKEEHLRQQRRLEARTGYLPLSSAVARAHDEPKHYHYSTEADMLNRIVLGMTSKQFKENNGVDNIRDHLPADVLEQIKILQIIDTGLILQGFDYQKRKVTLTQYHDSNNKKLLH